MTIKNSGKLSSQCSLKRVPLQIVLIENNVIITDDMKLSETFNEFFSSAVQKLNIEYYEPNEVIIENDTILRLVEKYKDHPSILKIKEVMNTNDRFSFKGINLKSVTKEILNLNISKANPVDAIPAKILKANHDIFAPKLLIDFNTSIQTGLFPKKQKLAECIPCF